MNEMEKKKKTHVKNQYASLGCNIEHDDYNLHRNSVAVIKSFLFVIVREDELTAQPALNAASAVCHLWTRRTLELGLTVADQDGCFSTMTKRESWLVGSSELPPQ